MLTRYRLDNGSLVQGEDAAGPVLVYLNPTDAERRFLLDELKIDEHTLNSALDPDEPSRLEFEPSHYALIFKRPKNYSAQDHFLFKVTSYGLFLFPDRLVMVVAEELSPLLGGKLAKGISSVEDVFLRILSSSIHHYIEHLKVINMISDEMEKKINSSMENKYLLNMFSLEKSLVYYLSAIHANGGALERLKNSSAKAGISQRGLEHLEDLLIENSQCYRQAEIYSNILASLMDARVSIVSNNLNILMKTLNLITIGIMVPTFVVSAFSMNVGIPFQHHPMAFWIIIFLALLALLTMIRWWQKKKW
ncbi:MAG: divalent metal ion transporter [Elusimicrobia bacterium GWA2_69_24]|nr:MAG: divalent metal ion transporter [Elusimicrobia bacterium GWA2_69_24]HAZ07934.1 divalent metal ion transporter [Elusimicrobiota bacterium]